MAQRHGTAVHVDLVAVQFQVADELFTHHGKGFVDFPQVDVVRRQPRLGQHLACRRHRAVEHQRGAVAHVGHGDHAATGFHAVFLRVAGRGQQQGPRAIHHAAGIARVVAEVNVQPRVHFEDQAAVGGAGFVQRKIRHLGKRGFQFGQTGRRGLRAGELLAVQRQGTVGLEDRDQALAEVAIFNGMVGALLALQRRKVQLRAADVFHGGNGVGAHALVGLRHVGAQAQVAGVHHQRAALGIAHPWHRHHLGATGNHQVFHA